MPAKKQSTKATPSKRGAEPGKAELPLFEVQTLITHRVRYAVRARDAEEAAAAVSDLDTEVCEFDQNCLGKMVAEVREVSFDAYLADPGHVGADRFRAGLIHVARPPEGEEGASGGASAEASRRASRGPLPN